MPPFRPLLVPLLCLAASPPASAADADWPDANGDRRPWLQWQWRAAPEESSEVAASLETIAGLGFGGIELAPAEPDQPPIDGGWSPFLSDTAAEARRVGLGLDLGDFPTGAEAPARLLIPLLQEVSGGPLELDLPSGTPAFLAAWPAQGAPLDLTPNVEEASELLRWDAPPGPWTVAGIFSETLPEDADPFSSEAAAGRYDALASALPGDSDDAPRCLTLDRHRVNPADWSPRLLERFLRNRGYDLRDHLLALYGEADAGKVARIRCDFRETLSDLQLTALHTWHRRVRDGGSLSRSRLRGHRGHPLDIHTITDFPGAGISGTDSLDLHLAASAAHLGMKPLVTAVLRPPAPATPATWKRAAHRAWLAGANHLVLDGRSGGPETTTASLDPAGLWDHLAPFNDYLTRCQSILQSGTPDPDLLLYIPVHDFWSERGGMPVAPAERARWLTPTGYQRCRDAFTRAGIGFDSVSDSLLRDAYVRDGRIVLGSADYAGLVIPEIRRMPETTATRLLELARAGGRIGFLGERPEDVPGYPSPEIRRGTLITCLEGLPEPAVAQAETPVALAEKLGVTPETMTDTGLRFVRRDHGEGRAYLLVNPTESLIDADITLATPARGAVLMDPASPDRAGVVALSGTPAAPRLRVVLAPGGTRVLRTFTERPAEGLAWRERPATDRQRAVAGTWTLEFPGADDSEAVILHTPLLGSWESLADPRLAAFTGTARYTISFPRPPFEACLLDLGHVGHTARVTINGNEAGRTFAPPHQIEIGRLLENGENELRVDVTPVPGEPAGLFGPVRLVPLDPATPEPGGDPQ